MDFYDTANTEQPNEATKKFVRLVILRNPEYLESEEYKQLPENIKKEVEDANKNFLVICSLTK